LRTQVGIALSSADAAVESSNRPFIRLRVLSEMRAPGCFNAVCVCAGSMRTISSEPWTPTLMLPWTRRARPPGISFRPTARSRSVTGQGLRFAPQRRCANQCTGLSSRSRRRVSR